MKPNYSISIPKPCHEDWSKMTPNEKGRFCLSCSKTVVDFTKMSSDQIQDYIHNNRHQRICGHIKQSQLDTINLKIPEVVFNQNLNFHRLFLLALLLSMGMTLFNCQDEKGGAKKIESVEIIETQKKSIDTTTNYSDTKAKPLDTTIQQQKKVDTAETIITEYFVTDGMMVVETGDIDVEPVKIEDLDSLDIKAPTHCPVLEGEISLGFINTEYSPEFKDTPKHLSQVENKKYFSDRVEKFVKTNFNQSIAGSLGIKGKQRIYTQFTINEKGKVENIKVRAPHPILDKEAKRVLNLLPKFKPARQDDKIVSVVYNLPITFIVEEH